MDPIVLVLSMAGGIATLLCLRFAAALLLPGAHWLGRALDDFDHSGSIDTRAPGNTGCNVGEDCGTCGGGD